MRRSAGIGLVVVLVAGLSLAGDAAFTPVAGPTFIGSYGSFNDFPNQIALVKDAAGNNHVLFHPRQISASNNELAYTMLGPDGSTKIATTTIYPNTVWHGPADMALTGSG